MHINIHSLFIKFISELNWHRAEFTQTICLLMTIEASYPGTIPSYPAVDQSCRPLLVSWRSCRYESLTQLQAQSLVKKACHFQCSLFSESVCNNRTWKIKQDRVLKQAGCNFDVNNITRKNLQSNSRYRIHFEEYVCVTFA